MATVDIIKLRNYMEDCYGTAAFGDFPVAMADLIALSNLNDYELCEYAEERGVDLTEFSVTQKEEN